MLVNTYKIKTDGTKTLLKQRLRINELPHCESGMATPSNRQKMIDGIMRKEKIVAEKKYLEEGVHSWIVQAEIVQFQIIP